MPAPAPAPPPSLRCPRPQRPSPRRALRAMPANQDHSAWSNGEDVGLAWHQRGLGAAMALGDPPADYASIAAVGLFVALMCVGIIVGHLLEENRWMNESITTLFIGLGTRAVILFASSEKHSRVLVFSSK
ncbi:Sodium/hydrogen exchanger 2 [Zea mays]|uniref:Sodium/hydrogen exchanger 2 n=1 Tax=Zea mays TaxID=4577 RepID=A0A1D6IH00_MAIZE|nr:Sodium/hydrogen exchanger 2 [Zea mays]ONM58807.1 Sodium/hydrogen exchanger 2 [Zea mays]